MQPVSTYANFLFFSKTLTLRSYHHTRDYPSSLADATSDQGWNWHLSMPFPLHVDMFDHKSCRHIL